MTSECVVCDRPTPDGYADVEHGVTRPMQLLAEIADMTQAARGAAYGLSRSQGIENGSGTPGPTVPLNLAAMAKLDAVAGVLTTWARHVAEERGIDFNMEDGLLP